MGGLDDMSTWTSIVWKQAANALLGGTEGCDMPHNTLAMNCDRDRDMDWVVDMMSKNLPHQPPDLQFLQFLPSFQDLEMIPEGRGVRIRIPESVMQNAMDSALSNYKEGIETFDLCTDLLTFYDKKIKAQTRFKVAEVIM